MELEILKVYIKTNFTNGFIRLSKLLEILLFFFIRSQTDGFYFIFTIKVLIILQS